MKTNFELTQLLLACANIQYLASMVYQVKEEKRMSNFNENTVISESIDRDCGFLNDLTSELIDIGEKIGDYMNNNEMVKDIDSEVSADLIETITALSVTNK